MTTAATRKKPDRGRGYMIESRITKRGEVHRVILWDAVRQQKVPVEAPDGSRTFHDLTEAHAAGEAAKRELDAKYTGAGVPVQRRKRRVGFAEYVWGWHEIAGGTTGTRKTRKTCLNAAVKRFPTEMLDEITESDLKRWDADAQNRGLSPSHRQSCMVYMNRMFEQAVDDELIDKNPARRISIKRTKDDRKRAVRYLTEEEFAVVLEQAPPWFKAALVLTYWCGLRAGEIAGLRWFRLRLDQSTVLVKDVIECDGTLRPHTKGGDERTVYLPEEAVTALRELRAMRANDTEEDFVFRSPKHGRRHISARYPNIMMTRAWDDSRLSGERPVFHHLRHGVATALAEAGVSATEIAAILGHKSIATSQGYIRKASVRAQGDAFARRRKAKQPQPDLLAQFVTLLQSEEGKALLAMAQTGVVQAA